MITIWLSRPNHWLRTSMEAMLFSLKARVLSSVEALLRRSSFYWKICGERNMESIIMWSSSNNHQCYSLSLTLLRIWAKSIKKRIFQCNWKLIWWRFRKKRKWQCSKARMENWWKSHSTSYIWFQDSTLPSSSKRVDWEIAMAMWMLINTLFNTRNMRTSGHWETVPICLLQRPQLQCLARL